MPGSRRVSVMQLEELVAWMESHPLQARGTQINNPQAKQSSHRLWEELTSRLNAVGDGATKTAKEWRQMGFDDSPSQPVPLLELPLPRPVTPDPEPTPSTSGHPTQDFADTPPPPPHTQPRPRNASQAHPHVIKSEYYNAATAATAAAAARLSRYSKYGTQPSKLGSRASRDNFFKANTLYYYLANIDFIIGLMKQMAEIRS